MNGYSGGGSFYDPWGHTSGIPNMSQDPYYQQPQQPQMTSYPDLPDTPTQLPLTSPQPTAMDLPDTPTQLPLTGDPGLPTLPSSLSDTPTQLPLTGEPGWPTLPVDQSGVVGPSGPLEYVGDALGNTVEFIADVAKTGLDAIWDTGKFILEHLDVGISYAGDISGQRTSKRYYESLAEAAQTKAQAYARAVEAGTMSQEEAIARGIADGMGMQQQPSAGPVYLTTPTAQAGGPNYMLYAAIGLAAYYFLR
jgi:hypothetical protein